MSAEAERRRPQAPYLGWDRMPWRHVAVVYKCRMGIIGPALAQYWVKEELPSVGKVLRQTVSNNYKCIRASPRRFFKTKPKSICSPLYPIYIMYISRSYESVRSREPEASWLSSPK